MSSLPSESGPEHCCEAFVQAMQEDSSNTFLLYSGVSEILFDVIVFNYRVLYVLKILLHLTETVFQFQDHHAVFIATVPDLTRRRKEAAWGRADLTSGCCGMCNTYFPVCNLNN